MSLEKIGGFVANVDALVNHDNTLSGNGTLTSPLGVVPGYNETVLWSGSGERLSAETQLSESMANFEKVEFWWGGTPGSQTQYYTVDTLRSPCNLYVLIHGAGGANCWQQFGRLSSNSDNYDKVIMDKGKSFNFGSFASTSWSNPTVSTSIPDSFYCYKIIGINRKQ